MIDLVAAQETRQSLEGIDGVAVLLQVVKDLVDRRLLGISGKGHPSRELLPPPRALEQAKLAGTVGAEQQNLTLRFQAGIDGEVEQGHEAFQNAGWQPRRDAVNRVATEQQMIDAE
jgi:hypothetical protein